MEPLKQMFGEKFSENEIRDALSLNKGSLERTIDYLLTKNSTSSTNTTTTTSNSTIQQQQPKPTKKAYVPNFDRHVSISWLSNKNITSQQKKTARKSNSIIKKKTKHARTQVRTIVQKRTETTIGSSFFDGISGRDRSGSTERGQNFSTDVTESNVHVTTSGGVQTVHAATRKTTCEDQRGVLDTTETKFLVQSQYRGPKEVGATFISIQTKIIRR